MTLATLGLIAYATFITSTMGGMVIFLVWLFLHDFDEDGDDVS